MKVALVGLMQSGKSSLLSALTGREPALSGTTHTEESIVPVPDSRFPWLIEKYSPKKITYATVDCIDVPGFNFADDSGRSMARKLIDQIRTVDMLVLVVRGFDSSIMGPAKIKSDISELNTEFLLADLAMVSTRIEKLQKQIQKPSKTQAKDTDELALQLKLQDALESEKPASTAVDSDKEREIIKSLNLLTLKPMMVVINCSEDDVSTPFDLTGIIDQSIPSVSLSASIEQEIFQLDAETKAEFMADLGIDQPASVKFVNSCYSALGLISFLTVGPDEVRAWAIQQGTTALDAAGKIHSDIKRGFIRAETMAFNDLYEAGDEKTLKAAGKVRLEGKAYTVQDGDIIDFRFNV